MSKLVGVSVDLHYDDDTFAPSMVSSPILGVKQFGDGTLLAILMQYLPQILAALKQAGILGESVKAEQFGDGEFLKKLLPFLIQILPLILALLKNENAGDISPNP